MQKTYCTLIHLNGFENQKLKEYNANFSIILLNDQTNELEEYL